MQIEKQRGALRLTACDAAARELGLKAGMTLAEARAIVPEIDVVAMDRAADRAALLRLAALCERYTPLVAIDGEDGLLLDVTGGTHLFGGEGEMQNTIAAHMTKLGLTLRHCMAGTPDCAHALARFSTISHVPPGDEPVAVSRLPVKALESSAETGVALIRAGLKTLGDLAARPSQVLTARFGAVLSAKLRRMLGEEDTRLTPVRPASDLVTGQLFPEPLQNLDMVQAALIKLIEHMCLQLERTGKGGRVFEATFFRADGALRRLSIETAEASREPQSLTRLFALRLDTLADPLDPGFGFDALRLSVNRSEALAQTQTQLDGRVEGGSSEAELIARLAIRFGKGQVLHFVAQDSHDPLRSAVALPVATPSAAVPWPVRDESLPRPLQLFSPPQPIEVMAEVPDGPPMQFRWRKLLHQVRAAEGPERIEAEWWRQGDKPPRDYYRVEDRQGSRFWIFREGLFTAIEPAPRWFLHGLFP